MTQKVFIFDMDGVLIRSEQEWIKIERDEGLLEEMFGKAIADKIAGTVGIAIGEIYKQGIAMGAKISKDKFMEFYEAAALKVYRRCQITPGTKELVTYLKDNGWLLALVSSSPMPWIKLVLDRFDWKDQ
ncbi:MAG TPA: HAD family hydrolase, partial [Patescibacteria group bacterium]|nr:HAD family hydrolase [Patescibacteria group bacterium]